MKIIEKVKENKNIVKKFMGYGKRKMPPIIERKLDEELNKLEKYVEEEHSYKIYSKEELENIFGQVEAYKIKAENAEKIAVITYTIGESLENIIKTYSESSEMIRGLIMDKAGVVALDTIHDEIIMEIEAKLNLKLQTELYPGTKDFQVKYQKQMIELSGTMKTVKINDHNQMQPVKTVTLLAFFGKSEETYDRCKECGGCDGINKLC